MGAEREAREIQSTKQIQFAIAGMKMGNGARHKEHIQLLEAESSLWLTASKEAET